MSVHNINLIQSNGVETSLSNSQKNQYIQALANLGQRIGVKGDSIVMSNLSFADIFENTITEKSDDPLIGVIKYSLDSNLKLFCTFGASYLSKIKEDEPIEEINYTYVNNEYTCDNKIATDIIINNIEYIDNQSRFKIKEDKFFCFLFEKIINIENYFDDDDSLKHNIQLSYTQYDTNTSKIDYAIRAFHINNDSKNNDNRYGMFEIKKDDTEDHYLLSCWVIDVPVSNELLKYSFDTYFCEENLYETTNLLNYDMFDMVDIEVGENVLDPKSNNIFAYIKENGYQVLSDVELLFDNTIANGFEITDKEYFIEQTDQYNALVDKSGLQLDDRIEQYLSNEISLLYPRMLEYYSTQLFTKDKYILARNIFSKLYETIASNEYKNLSLTDIVNLGSNSLTLYVPFSYNIQYYCNSLNENFIYTSSDIYVSFVNNLIGKDLQDIKNIITNDSLNIILCDYQYEDKICAYNFNGNYILKYDSILKNLVFTKIFTLPYIDKQTGNWKINDILTQFKSYSYSDTNQMILILYNYKDDNGNLQSIILNNVAESVYNLLNNDTNWYNTTCEFSTEMFTGTIENDEVQTFSVECRVPCIQTNSYNDIINNTILFVLSDKTTIVDNDTLNIVPENYDDFIIGSMWTFNVTSTIEKNNKSYYTFDYVKNSILKNSPYFNSYTADCAYDISKIFNVRSLAIRTDNVEKNIFHALILDPIELRMYKQTINSTSPRYIIYVPDNETYTSDIANSTDQSDYSFNNNLCISLKCKDGLSLIKETIDVENLKDKIAETNLQKFLQIGSNGKILSTDSDVVTDNIYGGIYYDTSLLVQQQYKLEKNADIQLKRYDNFMLMDSSTVNSKLQKITDSTDDSSIVVSKSLPVNSQISSIKANVANNNNSKSIFTAYTSVANDIKNFKLTDANSAIVNQYIENGVLKQVYSIKKNVKYLDALFNIDVPMLDLKEIFLYNSNTLNRLNILTLDKQNSDGKIYNSFIGSPIINNFKNLDSDNESILGIYNGTGSLEKEITNKEVLQIASSKNNINLGKSTLINDNSAQNFATQKLFHVRFDNILLESDNIALKTKKYEKSIYLGYDNRNTDNTLPFENIVIPNNPSLIIDKSVVNKPIYGLVKTIQPMGLVNCYTNNMKTTVSYATKDKGCFWDFFNKMTYSKQEMLGETTYDYWFTWNGDEAVNSTEDATYKYTYSDIITELYNTHYLTDNDNLISKTRTTSATETTIHYKLVLANADIGSFFIEMYDPNDIKENCYGANNVTISSVLNLQNYAEIGENVKKLYIFRLSDYLYKEFGFNITDETVYKVDEDFSTQNIIKIPINSDNTKYSYFIIYDEDDVEVKNIHLSIEDINNDNTNKFIYTKRPIQIVQRNALDSDSIKLLNILY